jgi:hypothetical protein
MATISDCVGRGLTAESDAKDAESSERIDAKLESEFPDRQQRGAEC